MKKIVFKCEVVTPMFIAGADGKTPEMRAPSIKGALRFWWRAINGHLSIDELRRQEAQIFGSSDEKIGKSKVIINVKDVKDRDLRYSYYLLPHKNVAKSPAFSPGTTFNVVISLRDNDRKFTLDNIRDLFIVFSVLGGLGKRARRGFGSFKITEIDKEEFDFKSLNNFFKYFSNLSENYNLNDGKKMILKSSLRNNFPFLRQVELGKEYNSYGELLKKIGDVSHQYDYDSLGYARGKKRFASPIYVSVLKIGNGYYPIISTLNTYIENTKIDISYQKSFKEAIL